MYVFALTVLSLLSVLFFLSLSLSLVDFSALCLSSLSIRYRSPLWTWTTIWSVSPRASSLCLRACSRGCFRHCSATATCLHTTTLTSLCARRQPRPLLYARLFARCLTCCLQLSSPTMPIPEIRPGSTLGARFGSAGVAGSLRSNIVTLKTVNALYSSSSGSGLDEDEGDFGASGLHIGACSLSVLTTWRCCVHAELMIGGVSPGQTKILSPVAAVDSDGSDVTTPTAAVRPVLPASASVRIGSILRRSVRSELEHEPPIKTPLLKRVRQ